MEPSTQKNAVPRKHGMQILGKVPSARRPPANLPSLKAETLVPSGSEQGGSWGSGSGSETGSNQQISPPTTQVNTQQTQQVNSSTVAGDKAIQNDSVKLTNSSSTQKSKRFLSFCSFSSFAKLKTNLKPEFN